MDTHRLPVTSPPFSSGLQENHASIWEMFLRVSGSFTLLWALEDPNLCVVCFSIFCTKQFLMSERHLVLVLWEVSPTGVSFFLLCCPVSKLCPTLCNSMDCIAPGFLVLHYLPEFAQTHVFPLSWWCHPTISSSVAPFLSCSQSFPAKGSFSMSQLFASGGQRIRASAPVLPVNIQDWFPLGLTGLISLQSKGLYSNTVQKH